MQHQVVVYDGNAYHFPQTIARKRTKKDILDKFVTSGIFLIAGYAVSPLPSYKFLLYSSAYCYGFYFTLEVVSRISSFREEYSHLLSRYDGKIITILQKLFSFNIKTISFLSISVLVIVIREIVGALVTNESFVQYGTSGGLVPLGFVFAAMYLFVQNIQMDESPVKMAKTIDRCVGSDYGSGMAINCFYGYLNIVLPSTGGNKKSLAEHITDFASREKVTFASTKLFLFIPKSGRCPPKLCDYSPNKILDQCRGLEPIVINRGGVKGRNYHNTVYKLKTVENGRIVMKHICAEFASAMQTFHEVRENTHFVTPFFREHKHEIVTNFYMTLQRLIQEKNFSNLCEIIYFEDRDENNQILYEDRLDIGDLLLQRLNLPSNN